MVKGDLVRQIESSLLDNVIFSRPDTPVDTSMLGVIIDTRHESSWLSGHGPLDEWYALVAWSSGTVKWISFDCLTNYGI